VALVSFVVIASLVVWRRGVGVSTAKDMRAREQERRALVAERTTLQRDIREAESGRAVVGEATRRLGMHVATDAETRLLPRTNAGDTLDAAASARTVPR
jgi:hypothetical protein